MSREQIIQMLCPGDCTTEWQETLNLEQIDQIGQWFLERPATEKWMNAPGLQILWGHGSSGTGKTFISSQVANHARSNQIHDNHRNATAIYFFDDHQIQTNIADFELPLCSIARQLATQLPGSLSSILDKVERVDGFYPASDEYSRSLFTEIVSAFGHTFIILDGVSASETAVQAILEYLRTVFSNGINLHVLITSQKLPPSTLKNANGMSIIKVQATKVDLQRYILHQVGIDPDAMEYRPEDSIQTAIADIVEFSGGRFPSLLLRRGMSSSAVLESLSEMRTRLSGLTDTKTTPALCECAISQAGRMYGSFATNVLQILGKLYQLRYPATAALVSEILKALGIVPEGDTFYTISDVIGSCPELIIVSHKNSEMRISSSLLQSYIRDQSSQGLFNRDLVKSSFKYLCDEEFHFGPCTSSEALKQRFQKYPFLPCAARIVSVYTSKVPDAESIFNDFLHLSSRPSLIETYFQAANAWPYRDEASYSELESSEERWKYIPRGYTPLHLAVHLVGGRYFIERLLQRGDFIEARTESGQTALHIAAEIEDESESVRTLLEHGADVSAVDETGDTPLSMAVLLGSLESVKLLVQHGACVDDLDEDVLFECADSRPEIAKYLSTVGVKMPPVDSESE